METLAVINQKGGVGKSTTALMVGVGLAKKGHKVLFIDLDAQGNLTYTLRATLNSGYNALKVLQNPVTVNEQIEHLAECDIIASTPSLAGADSIITEVGKEYRLREALDILKGNYDYCIIDTPPALGILTVNALTACDGVIIPAQADLFSLQGIGQLNGTIETVKKYCNRNLKVKGIVLTRYSNRSIISREMAEMMEETAQQLKTKLYETKIRECTAIKECQATRQNIFDYAPRSNAATDYAKLVSEILETE